MNKKILMACLAGFFSFFASPSQAQISVNFNIGAQPLWGPVGYEQANYYYLPDIDTYYHVPRRQYVYLQNNNWIFSNALPSRYSGYNLYNGYKIVLNTPRPYLSYKTHKIKYAKYKGYKGRQPIIRYSNDPKYSVVKGHPKHSNGGASGQAKKANYVRTKAHSGGGNGNSKGSNKGQGNEGKKGNGKGKH